MPKSHTVKRTVKRGDLPVQPAVSLSQLSRKHAKSGSPPQNRHRLLVQLSSWEEVSCLAPSVPKWVSLSKQNNARIFEFFKSHLDAGEEHEWSLMCRLLVDSEFHNDIWCSDALNLTPVERRVFETHPFARVVVKGDWCADEFVWDYMHIVHQVYRCLHSVLQVLNTVKCKEAFEECLTQDAGEHLAGTPHMDGGISVLRQELESVCARVEGLDTSRLCERVMRQMHVLARNVAMLFSIDVYIFVGKILMRMFIAAEHGLWTYTKTCDTSTDAGRACRLREYLLPEPQYIMWMTGEGPEDSVYRTLFGTNMFNACLEGFSAHSPVATAASGVVEELSRCAGVLGGLHGSTGPAVPFMQEMHRFFSANDRGTTVPCVNRLGSRGGHTGGFRSLDFVCILNAAVTTPLQAVLNRVKDKSGVPCDGVGDWNLQQYGQKFNEHLCHVAVWHANYLLVAGDRRIRDRWMVFQSGKFSDTSADQFLTRKEDTVYLELIVALATKIADWLCAVYVASQQQ